VMTRERLQRTRTDLPAVEAFWELFTSHTYGLGMYSKQDAQVMLERLAARSGIGLNKQMRRAIQQAGGGHPGLSRALFWALCSEATTAPIEGDLAKHTAVGGECAKIWNDFSADERRVVASIVADLSLHPADGEVLADLRLKQIVVGQPPMLFSSLFSEYVAHDVRHDIGGLLVDTHLRQVWVDGRLLAKQLSPLEFELLVYLARHADIICQRDDILRAIYKRSDAEPNDERLDTLLRRLREAIGDDAHSPRYLVTHRGVGIQLMRGRLWEANTASQSG
jgi:DNA-binding winged helix-turn-helix (wHTH) protein